MQFPNFSEFCTPNWLDKFHTSTDSPNLLTFTHPIWSLQPNQFLHSNWLPIFNQILHSNWSPKLISTGYRCFRRARPGGPEASRAPGLSGVCLCPGLLHGSVQVGSTHLLCGDTGKPLREGAGRAGGCAGWSSQKTKANFKINSKCTHYLLKSSQIFK